MTFEPDTTQHQPGRHVVLTNGRSGSNFLVDCLNQHSKLCNYGEVLGSYMPPMKLHERVGYGGATTEQYLDYVLGSRLHFSLASTYSAVSRLIRRRRPRAKRWNQLTSVGIKDFVIRFAERDGLDYLPDHPDVKVISLRRDNTLRRVISLMSMGKTGVVKVQSNDGDAGHRPGLEVDVDQLVLDLNVFEQEKLDQMSLADQLSEDRCLRLTYEAMFRSADAIQETVARAQRFLGVDPEPIEVVHKRILAPDLHEVVANYDEMVEAVEQAGFGRYLESDS